MKRFIIKSGKHQTIPEEIFNALSHAIAAGFSIAGMIVLIVLSSKAPHPNLKVISSIVFGMSLIILYATSTIYHSVRQKPIKHFCRILDHISIYLLIAGTYTPVLLILLPGAWGWSLFFVVWGLAVLGTIFKVFFVGRFEILSVVIYVGMGWLAIIAIDPIWQVLPAEGLGWLLGGGFFYTAGLIFYAMDKVRFAHSLWHLFVIAGSLCHYLLVLRFVIPVKF